MRQTVEETEVLKQHILEKAREVFIKKGFSDTKMQDIADAVHISRGPLYYHYANKLELFNNVVEMSYTQQYEATYEIFSSDLPFLEKLRQDLTWCIRDDQILFEATVQQLLSGNTNEFLSAREIRSQQLRALYHLKMEWAIKALEKGEIRKDADLQKLVNILFSAYGIFTINIRNTMEGFLPYENMISKEDLLDFVIKSIQREFMV